VISLCLVFATFLKKGSTKNFQIKVFKIIFKKVRLLLMVRAHFLYFMFKCFWKSETISLGSICKGIYCKKSLKGIDLFLRLMYNYYVYLYILIV
jgi:hypothetical protein